MPKVIEEAREIILSAARELLFSRGYGKLTIRSVAAECGIAVGTIYNYFPSKDVLVASIMFGDWAAAIAHMETNCQTAKTVEAGVSAIYQAIVGFSDIYRGVWSEYSGEDTPLTGFYPRHAMLREQIAKPLDALLARLGHGEAGIITPLLAETILAAAVQNDLSEKMLTTMIRRLF